LHGPSRETQGEATLSDLFRGRSQLLVYHFMFGPDYKAGCMSCSAIADGFNGFAMHLANHDVMLWAASRAPTFGGVPEMNCPICERPAESEYRPFCSRRCADVDLGRWLTGAYAIPAREDDPEDPEDSAAAPLDNGADPRLERASPRRHRR